MNELSVAIVAGGKSSRMGTDKAFVPLLGKPMIEHVLERVSDLGQDETILITNHPSDYAHLNLPMYSDIVPEKGSLGGIYTAIYYSNSEYILAVACDMPFLNRELLQYMSHLRMAEDGPFDVIVPRVANYPEAIHAIYRKSCLEPIRSRIDADKLKIIGFYDDVRVRYIDEPEYRPIDPNGLSFFNANTPEELAEAQRLADNN